MGTGPTHTIGPQYRDQHYHDAKREGAQQQYYGTVLQVMLVFESKTSSSFNLHYMIVWYDLMI